MKLVVIPTNQPEKKSTNTKETPAAAERGTADAAFKWWLPFSCQAKNYIVINGETVAGKCGSRGCLDCYPTKLRKWTQSAMSVRRKKGEQMYGIVLTCEKVQTREDVDTFLKNVRKTMKAWERSAAGIGAAWWVAECTVNWNAPPTKIPCPVPEMPITDNLDQYSKKARNTLESIVQGHGSGWSSPTLRTCSHLQCPYCRGRGYLPSVHLHAHVAVLSVPFYYGEGEAPEGQSYPQTFGGRGFRGLLNEYNLGYSSVEIIRKRRGLQEYMAKGMLTYMSKGARVKTGEHKNGAVDWEVSALDLLVAHAIYGRKRARGTNGRAYGIKRTLKQTDLDVSFGGSVNGYIDGIQGGDRGAALLSIFGEYTSKKYEEKEHTEPLLCAQLDVVEIGKRVIESGAAGRNAFRVLNKTQLDTPRGEVLSPEFRTFNEYGEELSAPVKLGRNSLFTSSWEKAPVITEKTWWTKETALGKMIGRGASAVHIRGAQNKPLEKCIEYIRMSKFFDWRGAIEETEAGLLHPAILPQYKEDISIPALPNAAK